MRFTYKTDIDIQAPVQAVWSVLTDRIALLNGDFGITELEGSIAEGSRLYLETDVAPGRGFRLTVAVLRPPNRMVWRGGMPLGLFKGVRTFDLRDESWGTHFAMREDFTGLMSALIFKGMPNLQPSFDQFAAALKLESERRAAKPSESGS